MSRLEISLLGRFQVRRDGEPVTRFGADTARALLAYLALHAGEACRREALAGLLWPEQPDSEALRNLRVALSRVRDAIGDRDQDLEPPFLQITRKSLQFDAESDYWLDVEVFGEAVALSKAHAHGQLSSCTGCMDRLSEAAALYRGDFLAGFTLDSAPFEEWLVVQRESLHLQALGVLYQLAEHHEGRGEYERALSYARRQVELEPWREGAHRQWMRALALSGHRGAALAQYETCRQVLAEELGVEPEGETRALYERIREGVALRAPPAVEVRQAAERAASVVVQETAAVQAPPLPSAGPAQFEGERRVVTALLAHVEKPVSLVEGIDLELWLEIVNEVLGILAVEVYRYGGEVSQLREDGLVATFGAATAHEDDPERAVLAALGIEQAMERYGADLVRRECVDVGLRLRVGVNTGEAVVTRIGDGRRQQMGTALGEAVSLVSRIGEAAEPGTVLVGEQTYRLVGPLFEWQTAGEVEIAGEHDAVSVYRPLAWKALPDKGRGIEGLESPLVGRDVEFQVLHAAIERLWAGMGGIVTVVGDAGIGKSRLVAEVRNSPRQKRGISATLRQPATRNAQLGEASRVSMDATREPNWIEGRCLSYATGVAYSLWLDVLRGLLGVAADAAPPAAADALREPVRALCPDSADEVYPFLAQMMSLPLAQETKARLQGVEAEGLKVLTFRAVGMLLERLAERKPLVVVCEDLHWADPTSLALLEHLLPLTDRVPLLLVCVFRPETEHPCWRIKEVATQSYRHRHTDLWLEPLTEQESAELVGHLLLIEDLSADLWARILGRAEGNPFYVEEILRALIDDRAIAYEAAAGRWRAVQEMAELAVPDTLRGVLMARIDRLPREARQVLQLASVVGRTFERRVLSAIACPPPRPPSRAREGGERLDEELVALQRGQMIRQRARLPEATYAFKHQLTLEAAYEGLLRRKRRDLHRRVAQALERLYPERVEAQLGLLAHHWERAGEVERAVAYLRRAGERATAQFANDEAIDYLGRALRLMPEEALAERYALLLARERVYALQGKRESQRQDLAALEALADALDDDRRRAEVALRRARYANRISDYPAAVAAAQAAVHLAQAAQDVALEAAGRREWGRALSYLQNDEAARPQLERALAQARAAWPLTSAVELLRQVEAGCLHTLGNVYLNQPDHAAAKSYYEQELAVYREVGDRRGEGEALRDLGLCSLYSGDCAAAQAHLAQSLKVCREAGNRRDEGWALVGLGEAWWFAGHCTQARVYCEQALRVCRETHDRLGEGRALQTLGHVYRLRGDYAEARDHFELALHIFGEIRCATMEIWSLFFLGTAFAEQGDCSQAKGYVEQALRTLGETRDRRGKNWIDDWERWGLAYLSLLYHYLGDDGAASACADKSSALLQEPLGYAYPGYNQAALGRALACLGRLREARDAYRQALSLWQKQGRQHLAVVALAGLARVSLAQGELQQAQRYVEEILGFFDTRPVPDYVDDPFWIYLACYRVLHANSDPRAEDVLATAYRLMHERADRIGDDEVRRLYLENVPHHREIAAEYAQYGHPDGG